MIEEVFLTEGETYTTVVSDKGQVVIPQAIREKHGLKPKTILQVTEYKDTVILKKLEVPDFKKQLHELYTDVDKKIAEFGEISQEEILQAIAQTRKKQKKTKKFASCP
jgi:AbrB family looped-hinge helix DNA binding protein